MILPRRSKTTARELVVPWSRAGCISPPRVLLSDKMLDRHYSCVRETHPTFFVDVVPIHYQQLITSNQQTKNLDFLLRNPQSSEPFFPRNRVSMRIATKAMTTK